MRPAIRLAALLQLGASALLLGAVAHADQLHVELSWDVRDYATNSNAEPGSIDLTATAAKDDITRVGQVYRLTADLEDIQRIDRIEVDIEPDGTYTEQRIGLRRLVSEDERVERDVRIYLVAKETQLTYSDLQTIRKRYLDNGRFERAFAPLEMAYSRLRHPETQYGVNLRYNYARVLQELCLRRSYATCESAAEICGRLLVEYDANPSLFALDEGIPRSDLVTCSNVQSRVAAEEERAAQQKKVADLSKQIQEARAEIARTTAQTHFPRSAVGEAALALDRVRAAIERDASVDPLDLRVTEASLYRDAGVAYTLYGDYLRAKARGASAEQKTAYQNAIDRFELSMGGSRKPDPALASSFAYAKTRLSQVSSD